jgi:hypothetical protein
MSSRRDHTVSPAPTCGVETVRVTTIHAAVKSLLLALFAGLVLALGTASPAAAATPCWKAVINDWFDGRIDKTYPPACYTQALKHLPRDVDIYSSAPDDIRRAQLAALALRKGDNNEPPTSEPSRSIESAGSPSEPTQKKEEPSESTTTQKEEQSKGLVLKAIEFVGPSDAASVPLPLLILAGVAFLLLAAAGGSFVNRRLQERRLPPPQ